MKTEQIIYLDDIAKTHSITQTAQRFFISQQALSFSLKKLEEEFDTIFLSRSNHGVTLTAEGNAFLQKARLILDKYNELKEEFLYQSFSNSQEEVIQGKLQILSHSRVLEPLLLDIFEKYNRKYPQIQITLEEQENVEIIESIAQNNGDFGIIFVPEPMLKDNILKDYHLPENIKIETLFSDDFIVCCNNLHPLSQQSNLTFDSFTNIPTVQFDTNAVVKSINSSAYDTTASHQYYSNNVSFHKAMIRRGLAVSVITAFEFRKLYFQYKDLIALPIADSCKSIISIVTNRDYPLSLAAQLFINMLKKYDFYGI